MCGRFTLTRDANAIARAFQATVPASFQNSARFNIAPTQNIVTVMQNGERHLDMLRWGLVPSWAKDLSIGSRMINARAETLAEKPSFKRLLGHKRCLIVADGFYEWKKEAKTKTPMYITLKDQDIFAFAGLWDAWKNPDGEIIRTCTIITTDANEFMNPIHNRMPAILTPEERDIWLDPTIHEAGPLLSLLKPYASDEMAAHPVSRQVNNPAYDSPELIATVQ
uniref:Abasic site processing protein n=1 Tax=Thermosporothrix sp. COM3 TaxID=2490863 RepID=A0A455SPG3_9CHLR|nr:DUF159 family protein [Thermosporothrix sp. COM3]